MRNLQPAATGISPVSSANKATKNSLCVNSTLSELFAVESA